MFKFISQFLKGLEAKRLYTIIASSIFFVGLLCFGISYFLSLNPSKVVGVQIITSKGTALVGRNKYSKNLSVWVSPEIGWFEKSGKPTFFYLKHKKEKSAKDTWEIVWEWDELYKHGSKEAIVKFVPTQEEKDAAIETLNSLCSSKKEAALSCQWNVSNHIFIESLTSNYICLSDLASEFYGGAHPIALRRFGTFDFKNKKFVRFDDFIQDQSVKEQIWQQLYENIKAVSEQSLLTQAFSDTVPSGGVDSLKAPEGSLPAANSNETPEQKLTALLNSQGYSFSPNVFCPAIRPDGPLLLFGFPHSEQVNRGLNFRAEAMLNQPKLPKKVLKLFSDYRFSKSDGIRQSELRSPDKGWKVSNGVEGIEVRNGKKKLTLALPEPIDSSEEILGIFWIYNSPNLSSLDEFKFKKVKMSNSTRIVHLAKLL